jgi:hypothetical protein
LLTVMTLALQRLLDLFADFLPIEAFALKAANLLLIESSALEFLANLLFLPGLLLAAELLLLVPLTTELLAFLLLHAADPLCNLLGLLLGLTLQSLFNHALHFLLLEILLFKPLNFLLAHANALQFLAYLLFLAELLLAELLLTAPLILLPLLAALHSRSGAKGILLLPLILLAVALLLLTPLILLAVALLVLLAPGVLRTPKLLLLLLLQPLRQLLCVALCLLAVIPLGLH